METIKKKTWRVTDDSWEKLQLTERGSWGSTNKIQIVKEKIYGKSLLTERCARGSWEIKIITTFYNTGTISGDKQIFGNMLYVVECQSDSANYCPIVIQWRNTGVGYYSILLQRENNQFSQIGNKQKERINIIIEK